MSQRGNRPRMSGGFDFIEWYNSNKNKTTRLGEGGLEVVDPSASTEISPVAPSAISPVAPTQQKPAAPAKPAVRNLPPSAAVPGTGPKNNQVGSDADPNQPGLQGSGDAGARVNANGLVSYGRDLSSLNAFTKDFTGGYELTDLKTAFQSNDLPMKGSAGTNTDYSVDDAVAMGATQEDALKISQGGSVETVIKPSTPGTLGNNPSDSQDGTSAAPTIADNVRTIRMNRRDQIRSTFLNHEGNSIQAVAAANAVAGYGKDSDGTAQFNYGGELVQAKEGMQQKAKNAAMMGQDPSQFLDIKIKEVQEKQKDKQ